jgi:hypothetical protein
LIAIREAEHPQSDQHQHYATMVDLFKRTYEALDPIFTELAKVTVMKSNLDD